MAGTKESNIVVASEPMCLPKLFPRGESKRRRSMVLSKAKRFSRHSKRASRVYIWRGRWAPDSARFPATTNGGYRYGKGGGEKSERCDSVVGCVLAEAVRLLPLTLFTLLPSPSPLRPRLPRFWLSRQYNSKMVAGLRVPLSFLSPVSARPPGYYCTPGATPWTLR